MLQCKCGNKKFYASQRVYLDIVVDEENNFLHNGSGGGAINPEDIKEVDDPYGTYHCTKCGEGYEELCSDLETVEDPGE